MLLELRVQNLLLIESAELSLDPGLNVITGETGAGKTVLAQALDLLLGGKPRTRAPAARRRGGLRRGSVRRRRLAGRRPGAGGAARACRRSTDEEVVLARRVTADGAAGLLQGRSASAADLRAVGTRLLSFYGQHEHRRLTLASAQLEVLDAFCGREHLQARAAFERLWTSARRMEQELEQLRDRVGARERDLDLLEFELRRDRGGGAGRGRGGTARSRALAARGVETLRQSVLGATAALEPDGEGDGTEGALSAAVAGGRRAGAARAVSMRPSTGWPIAPRRWPTRPRTSPASCATTSRRCRPTPAGSSRSRSASPPSGG